MLIASSLADPTVDVVAAALGRRDRELPTLARAVEANVLEPADGRIWFEPPGLYYSFTTEDGAGRVVFVPRAELLAGFSWSGEVTRHVSRWLLVAVGLMLLGTAASAGTRNQSARPKILAEVRGSILALAQEGRYVAWINGRGARPTTRAFPPANKAVQILNLPGRRTVSVRAKASPRGLLARSRVMYAIAVGADGRVLWQELTDMGNTYLVISLFTATARASRGAFASETEMGIHEGDPDWVDPVPRGLPLAADGKALFFYAHCGSSVCSRARESAIYRLNGRRSRRLARVERPAALAASGRRFAVVTNSRRCCNFNPAWSHDGTRVAWIYDGNLWTVHADGTGDRHLAANVSPRSWNPDEARRPSWSPDDGRLVFERTEAQEGRLQSRGVYGVDATGGGLRRLTSGTVPAWSPNGTMIAFVRGKLVFAIAPEGTGERRLTATGRATAGPLSWSPDSTRIAASRGGDIYSVRADGAGEMRLTTSRRREAQPAWSPDGARIAYVDGSTIAVVNADGSAAKRLTRGSDSWPAWSPDSKRIAFLREGSDLWLMNADGSGQRRLIAKQSSRSPQWAPGATIVVGDRDPEAGGYPTSPGIRLVSPVDGKTRKIAPVLHSPVQIHDASTGRLIKRFRIDGRARAIAVAPGFVAFVADHEPRVRVELYNLNGSLRQAVPVPASVRGVSAAGRSVVFATGRVIRRLDVRTGAVAALATANRTPVGLSIEGRRVVWAENGRGGARIRALTAP